MMMTDMMTKKGSENTLDHDEGGFIGQNQAFALKGINKDVSIEWNIPDITPQNVIDYQYSKMMYSLKLKI